MKKLQTLAFFALLWAALPAQNYPPDNLDTLPCDTLRQPNFYYNEWYDTSEWFLDPDKVSWFSEYSAWFRTFYESYPPDSARDHYSGVKFTNLAFQTHTPNPIRVRGIWAMVSHKCYNPSAPGSYDYVRTYDKLPEYAYLYQPDTSRDWTIYPTSDSAWWVYHLTCLASARWDTLTPKMMCIPTTADARYGYRYCLLYEIPLGTTITLDGEFWIGGSCNSNYYADGNPHEYEHFPTIYLSWMRAARDASDSAYNNWTYGLEGCGPWQWHFSGRPSDARTGYGPFGVILVDQRLVEVAAADTAQGRALGTGYYCDSTLQTITAVPNPAYRFSHWNDGDTNNPRSVFITCDTSFTAYFVRNTQYTVEVLSNDNTLGIVTGGGVYYAGEVAELTAIPNDSNFFVRWDDGDTANPRQIVVVSDTSFTAFFDTASHDTTGIALVANPAVLFPLSPNPATGKVTVTLGHTPQSRTHSSVSKADSSPNLGEQLVLTLRNAAGHEVLRKEFSIVNSQFSTTIDLSSLPAGAYFVTLTTPTASSTQRLVVK